SGRYRKMPPGHPRPRLVSDLTHLVETATLLAFAGYPPWVVAAGFMHDHPEDFRKKWPFTRLRREFSMFGRNGIRLVSTVRSVTKPEGLTWEKALEVYVAQLERGSNEACAVSCADKISNMRASERLAREGFPAANYLSRDWRVNYQKFDRIYGVAKDRVH